MTYVGFDGRGYRTGLAASDDLIAWERVGKILERGPEGAFDDEGAAGLSVLGLRELRGGTVGYMFQEQVPFWVRQYTRGVLERARQTPEAPEVQPVPGPVVAHGLLKGGSHLLVLIVWLGLVLLLADHAADLFAYAQECYFPPCY